jgi:signal peptidase I
MEMQSSIPGEVPQAERSYKRLWCAMLSGAIPGMGDWVLGNRKRAALFFLLFAGTLLCYWPLRIPRFYLPFLLLAVIGTIVHLVSACCTFLLGRSDKDRAANWWILVLISLAYVFSGIEDTGQLRASGFQLFSIQSDSMSPTINIHDYVLVDRWYFRRASPHAGDVVAFRHQGFYLVKRVVAANGSVIRGANGAVQVDGKILDEPYIVHRDAGHPSDERDDFGPYKLTDGEIFVMGDNRDFSLDSRFHSTENDYGHVFVTDVIGKPLYRIAALFHRSAYDGQPIK